MLTDYVNAAMQKAHYKILPDNEGYLARLNAFKESGLMQVPLKVAEKN